MLLSARGLHLALHSCLLFCLSPLPRTYFSYFISPPLFSPLGSGLRSTGKRGRCTKGKRLNDFLLWSCRCLSELGQVAFFLLFFFLTSPYLRDITDLSVPLVIPSQSPSYCKHFQLFSDAQQFLWVSFIIL